MELVDDAVMASSRGENSVFDPRIDELMGAARAYQSGIRLIYFMDVRFRRGARQGGKSA